MRINSYNKFFAEVAKIMNTEVKEVKQLDGRYKVELVNHVYLNVYRGVSGSLFIHDHRGISHITSCYDFEDFKAIKDLYERLTKDYSESSNTATVTNGKAEEIVKEQYFDTDALQPNKTIIAKIENMNHCPNQNTCCIVSPFVHCDYNYKSEACIKAHKNFIHDCEQLHRQMKSINNPNWHTVKLAIVNSSDFFRLNERLKLYISLYNQMKQTISYLRKCKTIDTYDTCFIRYIKRINVIYANGKISNAMFNFIKVKLSMQNVESGVWSSDCEDATGYCKSRRYNKSRLRR